MPASAFIICCLFASLASLLLLFPKTSSAEYLQRNFYRQSCPSAERIVSDVVAKAVALNPGVAPGLIRLHFHDCFVRGCDASILLESTPGNVAEKDHPANGKTLRGLQVIDDAKAKIEAVCPETVSCADILAFAARDSVRKVGGISYLVPAGRRDGRVSLKTEVDQNFAPLVPDVEVLSEFFAKKNLSVTEMVALSAAHSIGIAQCKTFMGRLYSFNSTHQQDPSLNPKFASFLKSKCPNSTNGGNGKVNLDVVTPHRLDNQYYKNLRTKMGLLVSDQALESNPLTASIVAKYTVNPTMWASDFAAAMIHMGSIIALTENQGEIRKNCRAINKI